MRKHEIGTRFVKLRQTVPFPVDRHDLFFSLFPPELKTLVRKRSELITESRNLKAVFPESDDRVYVQAAGYDPFWFFRVGGPRVVNTVLHPIVLSANNVYHEDVVNWQREAEALEAKICAWTQYARDHVGEFRTHVGGKRNARPDPDNAGMVETIEDALVTVSMLADQELNAWVMSPLS